MNPVPPRQPKSLGRREDRCREQPRAASWRTLRMGSSAQDLDPPTFVLTSRFPIRAATRLTLKTKARGNSERAADDPFQHRPERGSLGASVGRFRSEPCEESYSDAAWFLAPEFAVAPRGQRRFPRDLRGRDRQICEKACHTYLFGTFSRARVVGAVGFSGPRRPECPSTSGWRPSIVFDAFGWRL